MIGLRTGLATGLRTGLATGIGADEIRQSSAATTTQTIALTDNSTSGAVITGADAFAITAQYTNTGSNTATSVSVAITLDANATYVSSSGAGWSISGPTANVLTATRASAAVGAAPAITINLTSPSSATTLTTTAQATASNASTANSNADSITVNLVTKDATAGIYVPASSTEWTNFINRKGLSVTGPSALYLMQDASGNPADSIGSFTLTASGTGIAYQQAVTGWARQALTFTDGGTGVLANTSASLPSLATTSQLLFGVLLVSTAANVRSLLGMGTGTTRVVSNITATTLFHPQIVINATSATGTTDAHGRVLPFVVKHNVTGSAQALYTDTEKVVPTFTASAGQKITVGTNANAPPGCSLLYLASFHASAAELSDATVKALLQALGWTITWS